MRPDDLQVACYSSGSDVVVHSMQKVLANRVIQKVLSLKSKMPRVVVKKEDIGQRYQRKNSHELCALHRRRTELCLLPNRLQHIQKYNPDWYNQYLRPDRKSVV